MEARTQDYGAIGWAINHVRLGHRMRRTSWPKGAYIALSASLPPAVTFSPGDAGRPSGSGGNPDLYDYAAHQVDLLATDWEMLDPTLPGEYHSAAA